VHKPRAGNGQESDKRKAAPYLDRASSSTVARLSAYFRVLGEFERENVETISSKRLAERCGITSAQVRKDLSVFGNFGRRGLGYNVQDLRGEIGAILGLGRRWRVALIGAGNLGHALFAYREFQRQGFQIEAIFDVDPAKIGQTWDGVRIAPISELPQRAANPGIDIAIIAVPVQAAQQVVDAAIRAGIRGLLNFAPGKIDIPEGVAVRDVDLSIAMESLSYALVK
jgi:redox-sensing transcriptional repressor